MLYTDIDYLDKLKALQDYQDKDIGYYEDEEIEEDYLSYLED